MRCVARTETLKRLHFLFFFYNEIRGKKTRHLEFFIGVLMRSVNVNDERPNVSKWRKRIAYDFHQLSSTETGRSSISHVLCNNNKNYLNKKNLKRILFTNDASLGNYQPVRTNWFINDFREVNQHSKFALSLKKCYMWTLSQWHYVTLFY